MNAIIMLIMIPLTWLNLFGGLVSGIWLAILGEWGTIGYGLIIIFVGTFFLGLALFPTALLTGPAAFFIERPKMVFLTYPFLFLGNLYVIALITVWCGGVLYFFDLRADVSSFIPTLIWSYGVALGPWQFMAQKEAQAGTGDGSVMTTFFAQVGFVVMILMAIFMPVSLANVMIVFIVIMLIGLVFQFTVAVQTMRVSSELADAATIQGEVGSSIETDPDG